MLRVALHSGKGECPPDSIRQRAEYQNRPERAAPKWLPTSEPGQQFRADEQPEQDARRNATAAPHALRREENSGGYYGEDARRGPVGLAALKKGCDRHHGKEDCEQASRPDATRDAPFGHGLTATQRGASMRIGDVGHSSSLTAA
jgi:hypothetical protein